MLLGLSQVYQICAVLNDLKAYSLNIRQLSTFAAYRVMVTQQQSHTCSLRLCSRIIRQASHHLLRHLSVRSRPGYSNICSCLPYILSLDSSTEIHLHFVAAALVVIYFLSLFHQSLIKKSREIGWKWIVM